jgi:hypothetical protein
MSGKNIFVLLALILFSLSASAQSLNNILTNQRQTDETAQTATPSGDESEPVPEEAVGDGGSELEKMRAKIVAIAREKVGTVHDRAGEDGYRIGWQHMIEFYQTAYRLNDLEKERPQWVASLKGVGKQVNSWCGIFNTWAWMKAGLPVYWNTRVEGCRYRGDKAAAGPGDIIILKKSVNPYNHHAIIGSVSGDSIETIDGNQGVDSIRTRTRKLSDVEIFYSVADALGVAPVTARPPSTGSGASSGSGSGSGSSSGSGSNPSTGSVGGGSEQARPPMSDKEVEDFVRRLVEAIMSTFGFF